MWEIFLFVFAIWAIGFCEMYEINYFAYYYTNKQKLLIAIFWPLYLTYMAIVFTLFLLLLPIMLLVIKITAKIKANSDEDYAEDESKE